MIQLPSGAVFTVRDSEASSSNINSTVRSSNEHFITKFNELPKEQQPDKTNILQVSKDQQRHEQTKHEADSFMTNASSPKPNQVATVLLYGIPIVSLYIESQERLCLAQISNTLLKQFSYNEIHNRRVALGITCVQCTPVQLEILRRAGAMPVSSRRCGMITRREAERLCKSFLGDNAPPRLPDDFAFDVHHKCAWGCRGSFLPSRYNSSRAKCIKCSFCGLFFSPNKFIFHSHRIGPDEKYVQPDAANFNSWRRHMKLSGNPPEKITHAWEDVKAMFNGGTRKRLMAASNSHDPISTDLVAKISNTSTISSSIMASSSTKTEQPPKRMKESPSAKHGIPCQKEGQMPCEPHNIHQAQSLESTAVISGCLSSPNITLPFSRNFMMDYMWHAHAQNKRPFPSCSLPWIKAGPRTLFFGNSISNAPLNTSPTQDQTLTSSTNPENTRGSTSPKQSQDALSSTPLSYTTMNACPEKKYVSGLYNNSAFKPVIKVNRSTASYTTKTRALALETVAAAAVAAAAAASSYAVGDYSLRSTPITCLGISPPSHRVKESYSSDDEMVDIETTEEEEMPLEMDHRFTKSIEEADESGHQIVFNLDGPIEIDNFSHGIPWSGILQNED